MDTLLTFPEGPRALAPDRQFERWSARRVVVAACLLATIAQLPPSIAAEREAHVLILNRTDGFGILGRSMESYERRGRLVVDQVQAAIAGESFAPRRVPLATPGRCIVDARVLRRWSLDASPLPAGREISFAQGPYWRRQMWRFVVTAVIILGQGALITMLIVQLRRRRSAERALQSLLIDATHTSRLAIAGELTASIAHEIKQPLAAILSNTETAEFLLQSDGDLRDSLRPILADIRRDDLRASEVIRRLRALLAEHEVEQNLTDLNAVIADVCALLHDEAQRRGVRIAIHQESVAQIMGDRIQIQQVLINLIMNAMDAVKGLSEERRTIIVSVTSSAQSSTVKVCDLGPGIHATELPKVFNSFYSTKHMGMGLGLSIARTIVESHGGRIGVESRPGGGTEFYASFPAIEPTAQAPRSAAAS